MKWKCVLLLYTTIYLKLSDSLPTDESGITELKPVATKDEEQHSSNAFRVTMNLLEKIDMKDNEIEDKNREIKELQARIVELEQREIFLELYKQGNAAHIQDLRSQIGIFQTVFEKLSINCQSPKNNTDQLSILFNTIATNSKTIREQNIKIVKLETQIDLDSVQMQRVENQLEDDKDIIRVKDEQITKLKTQVIIQTETQVQLNQCKESNLVDSCIPFGTSPGIHKIKVPGLDPFHVLCASAGTEPGWIVIQQRTKDKEFVDSDWAAYRAGFESFEEDFFLGLEKIHRLTSSQQYELYITLERLNGDVEYATFEHFAIAGEEDQYRLISVEGFSGNLTDNDNIINRKGEKFYTFDRDNFQTCARTFHGGWWGEHCQMYDNLSRNADKFKYWYGIWYESETLKQVKMLIRPKAVQESLFN